MLPMILEEENHW